MDAILVWILAMGSGLMLGYAIFGIGRVRKRKCWSCGEKIRQKEAFHDGIAYHDLHRRCHKTREDVYSGTWDFLSKKYVEAGYPPASYLFPQGYELIQDWDQRMKEMREYEYPDWSIGADHHKQTGIPISVDALGGGIIHL